MRRAPSPRRCRALRSPNRPRMQVPRRGPVARGSRRSLRVPPSATTPPGAGPVGRLLPRGCSAAARARSRVRREAIVSRRRAGADQPARRSRPRSEAARLDGCSRDWRSGCGSWLRSGCGAGASRSGNGRSGCGGFGGSGTRFGMRGAAQRAYPDGGDARRPMAPMTQGSQDLTAAIPDARHAAAGCAPAGRTFRCDNAASAAWPAATVRRRGCCARHRRAPRR